jgi:hypothetical protein
MSIKKNLYTLSLFAFIFMINQLCEEDKSKKKKDLLTSITQTRDEHEREVNEKCHSKNEKDEQMQKYFWYVHNTTLLISIIKAFEGKKDTILSKESRDKKYNLLLNTSNNSWRFFYSFFLIASYCEKYKNSEKNEEAFVKKYFNTSFLRSQKEYFLKKKKEIDNTMPCYLIELSENEEALENINRLRLLLSNNGKNISDLSEKDIKELKESEEFTSAFSDLFYYFFSNEKFASENKLMFNFIFKDLRYAPIIMVSYPAIFRNALGTVNNILELSK